MAKTGRRRYRHARQRARREGWQEVGASQSTEDAGEFAPGDPAEGEGRRGMGLLEGTMDGTPSPENISPGIQRIAELRRVRDGIQSTVTQRIHDPEEPDAGNLHVRICGGPGRTTSPVYPTLVVLVGASAGEVA